MQANAKQYPEVELLLSFAFPHPRYCPKIIGHIPKNKKKEKVCLLYEVT